MDPAGDLISDQLGELARKSPEPETRRVVFDPDIPERDLRLLKWRADRLIAASLTPGPARRFPLVPPMRRFDRIFAMGILLVAAGLIDGTVNALRAAKVSAMIKSEVIGLAVGVVLGILVVGSWGIMVMVRETIPADRAARTHHGRYLLPDDDLDPKTNELYARAERAFDKIKRASVVQDGRLAPDLAPGDIDRWKWQIARQLREATLGESGKPDARITDRVSLLERLALAVTDLETGAEKNVADGDRLRRVRLIARQVPDQDAS